jgi:AcrR family transcriptional regulator
VTSGRHEQRKAATHAKIIAAAHGLFVERGYAATSMEDIARAADVAIRTIYLHFDSKAAVLLAYHDAWLDAFVRLLGERRPGEPLDVALRRTLDGLVAAGFDNDRGVEDLTVLPPFLEFIGSGSPEIAGHILHRWVAAQDELTARFREISGAAAGSALPRIEASAVFAAWMTSILDVRERWALGVPGASGHDLGAQAMAAYVAGLGTSSGS